MSLMFTKSPQYIIFCQSHLPIVLPQDPPFKVLITSLVMIRGLGEQALLKREHSFDISNTFKVVHNYPFISEVEAQILGSLKNVEVLQWIDCKNRSMKETKRQFVSLYVPGCGL